MEVCRCHGVQPSPQITLYFFLFAQLVTGVLEGGYNFFCQDTHSGGEADMKVP